MTNSVFPPSYTVRKSCRAKRARLKIAPGAGLEVILPYNYDESKIPDMLNHFRPWIEKHYNRLCNISPLYNSEEQAPLFFFLKGGHEFVFFAEKEESILPALLDENMQSLFTKCFSPHFLTPSSIEKKVVRWPLRSGHGEGRRVWLKGWLREQAHSYLGLLLEEIAATYSFTYSGFSIRFQKTRWGSCSVAKNISLNARLIFLPEKLIRYILLHELCHTKVMNHSDAFWKQVFKVDPDALKKDRAMRGAWRFIPHWAV